MARVSPKPLKIIIFPPFGAIHAHPRVSLQTDDYKVLNCESNVFPPTPGIDSCRPFDARFS